jgi:hypothetical protein
MKLTVTPLTSMLAILGIMYLAMVPVMALAPARDQPPMAATVLSGLLGAAALASIPGLIRGRRWAFWTAMTTGVVGGLNSFMGLAFGPEVSFKASGGLGLALSIAAVVALIRLRPGHAVGAASGA